MRSLSTNARDAIISGAIALRTAVYFEVGAGYGLFDDIYDITFSSRTFIGRAGQFQVTPSFASVTDGSVHALDVVFSGVNPTVYPFIFAEAWHQKPMQVYRVIINPFTLAVLDTSVWFSGYLDAAPVEEAAGGDTTLTVRCESTSRDLERPGTATRSEASQRRINANDGFFKHVAKMRTLELWWGQVPPKTAGGTGGGGIRPTFNAGNIPRL